MLRLILYQGNTEYQGHLSVVLCIFLRISVVTHLYSRLYSIS